MADDTPSGLVPVDLPSAVFEQAFDVCSKAHGHSAEEVLHRLDTGDRELHSTFRYGVAKGLAEYLKSLGSVFRGVYVHGSAIGQRSSPASDIDLIVLVGRRRDELSRFLGQLDLAIVTSYRRLVRSAGGVTNLLDIQIVDEREQEEQSGYGAVIHGVHTRPICLWRSHPATHGGPSSHGAPSGPATPLGVARAVPDGTASRTARRNRGQATFHGEAPRVGASFAWEEK